MKKLLLTLLGLFAFNLVNAADIAVTFINTGAATAYNVQAYWRNAASPIGSTPLATPSTGDMSPGETDTGTGAGMGNAGITIYIWVAWYTNSGAVGNITYSGPTTMPSGTAVTLSFAAGGTPPVTNYIHMKFCAQNNTRDYANYGITYNGNFISDVAHLSLMPGASGCYTFILPADTATNGYSMRQRSCPLTWNGVSWVQSACVPVGDPLSVAVSTNTTPADFTPGVITQPNDLSNVYGTNAPIIFSSTNSQQAIEQGLQVLYSETARGNQDARADSARQQALQSQGNTLLSTINTTAGSIKTSVDAVKTSVDSAKSSIDAVKTSVDAVNTTLSTANNSNGQIATNTGTAATKLSGMAVTASNQLAVANSSQQTLAGISNNSSYANTRLDQIYANGTDANTRLTSIGSELNNIEATGNGIEAGMNRATNELGQIKGLLNGMGTNGDYGVKGAVDSFHTDNTNLLAALLHGVTNGHSPGEIPESIGTNYGSALSAGTSDSQGVADAITGAIDGIGSAPSFGGGGNPGMSFEFCGQTLDLDPNVRFPGAASYVKTLIALVATIGFALSMSQLFFKSVQSYTAAQSGGVPNIGTPFEAAGNATGVIAAPIVAAAIILTWTVVFFAFFSLVGAQVVGLGSLTMPTNPSGIATYLLDIFIPVSLLLTFAWTRIVAHFAMGKLMWVAGSITRYLIGH